MFQVSLWGAAEKGQFLCLHQVPQRCGQSGQNGMFSSYVKCPDLAYLCRREHLWFLGAGKKREVVADRHRVSSEGGRKMFWIDDGDGCTTNSENRREPLSVHSKGPNCTGCEFYLCKAVTQNWSVSVCSPGELVTAAGQGDHCLNPCKTCRVT